MSWKSFGYKSYQEYLESDLWKEKKEHIMKVFKRRCYVCHSYSFLVVHHKTYESVCNEGKEDVVVLCRSCHEKIHKGEITLE